MSNTVITILEAFELPKHVNAFVQATSEKASNDPSYIEELATALDLDVSNMRQDHQLSFVQYAVAAMLWNSELTNAEAATIALGKTESLFNKHPYLSPKRDGETEQSEPKVRDTKARALAIYEANKQKTTAELVNLIADQLQITKANSRYYVSRSFGHKDAK